MAIQGQTALPQTSDGPETVTTSKPHMAPIAIGSLHPALDQVASALGQVEPGRWKVPREWKHQLREDADSIQQDISSQLPALVAKAQTASGQIGPQLAAMQNVNALYDVLVRVTTAANLGGNKADAGLLNSALQQLESSRKSVSDELQREAAVQDQRVVQLQAQIPRTAENTAAGAGAHTIIVDDDGRHRAKHHKPVPHKKTNPTTNQPTSKTPSPNQ